MNGSSRLGTQHIQAKMDLKKFQAMMAEQAILRSLRLRTRLIIVFY